MATKVLVFQIGSLGDTIIAMPCYQEIERRHPDSQRFLLTNFPKNAKMVPAEALLKPCGLIHGAVEYPMPLRSFSAALKLIRAIRAIRVDVLYYLSPETRLRNLIRHYTFFKLCGVRKVCALPWTRDLQYPREVIPGKLWESEASRLLRNIEHGREAGAPDSRDRCLNLTYEEKAVVQNLLARTPEMHDFIALSVGGKVPLNNWGDENWSATLNALSSENPSLGIVFVGSADERERNEKLATAWLGPKLNSCGLLTPRQTAVLIARAVTFVGHDTGTLHLAAAVGTKIVGVYSARNKPGKWYSDRPGDRFFYNKPPCFGCELEVAADCPNAVVCMTSHRPHEVVAAVQAAVVDVRRGIACADSLRRETSA